MNAHIPGRRVQSRLGTVRATMDRNACRTVPFSILVLLAFAVTGCGVADIDATYGKRRGSPGAESVNGTAVLASMFESAGHKVITWRRLSPKLHEFDVIVWFPDDFALPTGAQRRFLEDWLSTESGRTLIYVGRDYDAATAYWKHVQPLAPPAQAVEIARRSASAQAVHAKRRAQMPAAESCDWFTVQANLPHRQVKALRGPWSEGIDASKVNIELDARFAVPSNTEIEAWLAREGRNPSARVASERLLYTNEDPLVTRLSLDDWVDGQILVVTNGSFLLNLPLVNREHRKLAGKLMNACGPDARVAFLESDESGPPILEQEPGASAPTGFEVFTVWPIGVILLHLTALGILACITLFPVFGRPRELPPVTTADFGQHVTALGELLELTGDREYALNRLKQYHEQIKNEPQKKRNKRR